MSCPQPNFGGYPTGSQNSVLPWWPPRNGGSAPFWDLDACSNEEMTRPYRGPEGAINPLGMLENLPSCVRFGSLGLPHFPGGPIHLQGSLQYCHQCDIFYSCYMVGFTQGKRRLNTRFFDGNVECLNRENLPKRLH
jgi:hypothetical protein